MSDSISFLKKDDPEDVVYKRIVNESNLQKFMNELQTIDWNINYNNVEDSYNSFLAKFQSLYDKYFPLKKCKHSKNNKRKP